MIRTVPLPKSVAVCKYRAVTRLPVPMKLGGKALNSSALDWEPPDPKPPQRRTEPFGRSVAVWVVRAVIKVALATPKVRAIGSKTSALFRKTYPAELPV